MPDDEESPEADPEPEEEEKPEVPDLLPMTTKQLSRTLQGAPEATDEA